MIKSAEYTEFEEGFLKEAKAAGCDVDFLRGYIKQADEVVEIWKNAFDELAEKSKDPLYHYKISQEIMYLSMLAPELEKKADLAASTKQYQNFLGGMNEGGMEAPQKAMQHFAGEHTTGMGGGIMKWLQEALQKNPNMLSSLATGAGGGGLLGLLLGAVMGRPGLGLMLGGLGGAGLSAFAGNQNMVDGAKGYWNKLTAPKPAGPAGDQLQQVSGTPNPQMGQALNSNQSTGDAGIDDFKNVMHAGQDLTRNNNVGSTNSFTPPTMPIKPSAKLPIKGVENIPTVPKPVTTPAK